MMLPATQQQIVSLGLLGLGIYFTVQLVRGLLGYRRYLRVVPTAVATWPAPRQPLTRWLVALGAVGGAVALLNAWLQRPPHHVYGLAVMSAYFVVMVPLATRIRLGLYRDGIWADAGFIRWEEIARVAFRETPEVVLLLLPRTGRGSFRLPVPPGEYGTVRKLLAEKSRDGELHLDPAILGLL
jgi:hypothetical protein